MDKYLLDLQNQVILNDIKKILVEARTKIAQAANNELLIAYWNVGRIIFENEQFGLDKSEFGGQLFEN